jgi:hypothetical protein
VRELVHEESQLDAVLERERDAVANESAKPASVEPALPSVMKISPGWPSSYMPTLM